MTNAMRMIGTVSGLLLDNLLALGCAMVLLMALPEHFDMNQPSGVLQKDTERLRLWTPPVPEKIKARIIRDLPFEDPHLALKAGSRIWEGCCV